MCFDVTVALQMVKARLNRLPEDTSLDEYLTMRLEAMVEDYKKLGIRMDPTSTYDTMLLVDDTVWQYQNRDKATGMPDWLRLRRRERWLHQDDT